MSFMQVATKAAAYTTNNPGSTAASQVVEACSTKTESVKRKSSEKDTATNNSYNQQSDWQVAHLFLLFIDHSPLMWLT